FRPVLAVAGPQPVTTGEDDATGEEPADDGATVDRPADDADDATGDTADDATAPDEDADAATDEPSPEPSGEAGEPTNPSDLAWLTDDLVAEFDALDCTDPANLRGGAALVGDPDVAVVTCDVDGTAKFALGPVEIEGDTIDGASSGLRVTAQGAYTTEWVVNLEFDSEGTAVFADTTTRLLSLESPRDQFAIVLDGLVISAPAVNTVIPNGQAEISGSFDQKSA